MRSKLWWPAVWPAAGSVVLVLSLSLSAADGPIELGVKGRGNATPTIAAAGPFVAVTWGGTLPSGATDVFAAASRDGGRTFAAPVRVNSTEGDTRLNGEQPPHVALVPRTGREPAIVVVWTTKGANGTTLLQSRSDDGGRSFASSALVPGSDAAGNRGWEAIAVEPAAASTRCGSIIGSSRRTRRWPRRTTITRLMRRRPPRGRAPTNRTASPWRSNRSSSSRRSTGRRRRMR